MGRATSLAFAEAGAAVLVADIDSSGGEETAGMIVAAGGAARFVETDVSNSAAAEAMVAAAVDAFGRLDCAVNNAAIENESTPLADSDDANFDRIIGASTVRCGIGALAPSHVTTEGHR